MTANSIVIVGGGHAGIHAAACLRNSEYRGRLVILDRQPDLPYERPPLSKGLMVADIKPERIFQRKESFYQDKGIDLRRGIWVEEIDRSSARLGLSDGSLLAYDKLLLATGSNARALTVPGCDLDGIVALRTLADAVALKARLSVAKRVAVVGAGYIGLEIASVASKLGKLVHVFEREDRVMSRVAGKTVSRFFEQLHAAHGVRLDFGRMVMRFEGRGRVESVITTDGQITEADLVIIGIGITPAQEIAVAAGVACSDGIIVDAFCRTSDPAIYAAGDVTRHTNLMIGDSIRLECVQNAVSQAETAARAMMGKAVPYAEVPWFWTEQFGCRLQSAGLRRDGDVEYVRGNLSSGRFAVLYLRDGKLAAIDTVNLLKDFLPGKRLIAEGSSPPANFQDTTVPLS